MLDAKRDLRSVGDEMVIDLLCRRLSMAHGHWGRAAPIAAGGTGIVRWKRNLNLSVTHTTALPSPDCTIFCAGRCGLLPSSSVLPCAVHVLPPIVFVKAKKGSPPPDLEGSA